MVGIYEQSYSNIQDMALIFLDKMKNMSVMSLA